MRGSEVSEDRDLGLTPSRGTCRFSRGYRWIPAIASSACGATGDPIRDNETGFTYPWGDVPTLAERLSRLASDPDLRDRLAHGARRISHWGQSRTPRRSREPSSNSWA
jgi:hypothetical protein